MKKLKFFKWALIVLAIVLVVNAPEQSAAATRNTFSLMSAYPLPALGLITFGLITAAVLRAKSVKVSFSRMVLAIALGLMLAALLVLYDWLNGLFTGAPETTLPTWAIGSSVLLVIMVVLYLGWRFLPGKTRLN